MRTLVVPRPGVLEIEETPEPPLADGCFRAETLYSGLSAGTELTWYRGTSPYLSTGWDAELGLFGRGAAGPAFPVRQLGYMEVARVTDSRTPAVAEGTVVAMAYGHATVVHGDPVTQHVVPLPAELDPLLGVYVAHLGPICANGVLHAAADAGGRELARRRRRPARDGGRRRGDRPAGRAARPGARRRRGRRRRPHARSGGPPPTASG